MAKVKQPKNSPMKDSYRPMREISFDSSELPEIKKWDVDGKYVLHLHVTQVSKSKGDSFYSSDTSGKTMSARFKVDSVTGELGGKASGVQKVKQKYGAKRQDRHAY